MDLRWPRSGDELKRIQSERKRRAVETALRAPFFRDRLKGINPDRLDDPQRRTGEVARRDDRRSFPDHRPGPELERSSLRQPLVEDADLSCEREHGDRETDHHEPEHGNRDPAGCVHGRALPRPACAVRCSESCAA